MNKWIDWAKQIKAISQIGLTYCKDQYDIERYNQLTQISHEMFASLADVPTGKVDNLFIQDNGYATPKIDLRAAVIKDGKILLARERSDNRWTLPGGWADVCESPKQGIIRETLEETGYNVDVKRLIMIKDRGCHPYYPEYSFHIYKHFFLCEITGGTATSNLEISEIEFFAQDKLPELSETRVYRKILK